jgi:hypothetical protein
MSMNNFNDDDLATISAGRTTPAQPQTAQVTKGAQQQSAPKAASEDITFGSDEADEIARAADGLPTVKIGKTEAARFAFVPGMALKHAKVHYREGFGSYKCLSKDSAKQACCKEGDPKDRFVAMVFRYLNSDPSTGRMAKDKRPEVAVQALRLSRSNFRDITNLGINDENETSNPAAFDIIMSHDPSRAFGYQFKAAQVLRWKELGDAPLELVKPFADGVALSRRLGKTLTLAELPGVQHGDDDDDDDREMKARLAKLAEDDFN